MNLKPEELMTFDGNFMREAADQIERDQKEIAELKAKVEQYRALIPSLVIPMTDKED